jgi:hypothetical protein
MIDRNGVQAGTEDSRACSGNSLIQGEPAEEEKRSALVWAGFWLYDGQTRNYRAGSCLSGLESRIPLSMYVANITRASETRGAQFHSREHKQRIGHNAH